jgi:hypothetical protein
MIPDGNTLRNELETGAIPIQVIFANADCDQLTRSRGASPAFDTAYTQALAAVNSFPSTTDRDRVQQIRDQAYVFAVVASNRHEITSFVWNDFEIIARISDIRHNGHLGNTLDDSAIAFADWIYNEYRQGRFPTPPLPSSICG